MSKKRDSDTLFELITRQKAKPSGPADDAPTEGAPTEGAPTEGAPDEVEHAEAEAVEAPEAEAAPAAVEAPPAVEPQPQPAGATPRFGETSVPFSVKVIVVTALVIFAFLLGRYTARKGQSDEPAPAPQPNHSAAPVEPGPGPEPGPGGNDQPGQPTMTRQAGKVYLVLHATSGGGEADEQEANQIAVFCAMQGYPANVEYWIDNYDQHFYAVWSYDAFDSKTSPQAVAFKREARALGTKYYRQQAVEAGRSPDNITREFDPWYVLATPELLD